MLNFSETLFPPTQDMKSNTLGFVVKVQVDNKCKGLNQHKRGVVSPQNLMFTISC